MSDDSDSHLFIPGPAGSTPEVIAAAGRPIAPHYGAQFVAVYNRCIDLFKVPPSGGAGSASRSSGAISCAFSYVPSCVPVR